MNEVWKDILNYKDIYQVSDRGRVRSLDRITSHGRRLKGRVLKPGYGSNNYFHVRLCKQNKCKSANIHILVLQTFIDNCPKGLVCRHLDGNSKNNNLLNLKWGTWSENNSDTVRHGHWCGGKEKIRVKRSDGVIFGSLAQAGKETGIDYQNINHVLRKRRHTAGGYRWSYA